MFSGGFGDVLCRRGPAVLAAGAALFASSAAFGTWSIIIIDTRTGEVAVGSATCLTGFDLRADTPVLLTGIGAATAQSAVDQAGTNRVFIRDALLAGIDPEDILIGLEGFDPRHQSRQYGIADTMGRTATFSGTGDGQWAGGMTGRVGDLVYAVQGNVLTGEPVVASAVQAIISTPGDVPAKLMAAMEAARSFGGDGRCSCNPSRPDSCGSPPPDFTKAAHVSYMLIARAGDDDACNSIYPVGRVPWGLTTHDLDGDGRLDLAIANTNSGSVSLLTNTTEPGSRFSTFAPLDTIPTGRGPREVQVVDMTGDGVADLVVCSFGDDTVSIYPGLGGGAFGDPAVFSSGDGPFDMVVADFDGVNGPDVALANKNADQVQIMLNDGAGNLSSHGTTFAGDGPTSLVATDLDNDSDIDVAVVSQFSGVMFPLLNDGTGTLTPGAFITLVDSANDIVAGDFDGNAFPDLAITSPTASIVTIVLRDGASATPTQIEIPSQPLTLAVGDVDQDGKQDLAVMKGFPKEFTLLLGDGAGGFAEGGSFGTGQGSTGAALRDFNGDGKLDLAVTLRTQGSVLIATNNGDATFPVSLGCAAGDFFMNFNVAFQQASDPDPVFQLQDMFDAWRADHVGRPDAVGSAAVLGSRRIPADGLTQTTLRITLRDWQGSSASAGSLSVEHAEDSAGLSTIGPVTDLGGGVFEVQITAGSAPGTDRFVVTADDGIRPVVLMPNVVLEQSDPRIDFNGDGQFTVLDFFEFIRLFAAGDLRADLDGDGSLTFADLQVFIDLFG